ncbi:MAG: RNA polymerase sigma factor [Pseudomonadota bacterium]
MKCRSKLIIEQAIQRDEKKLINYLTKFLGDADTARDIAQSAFLRTWEYAEKSQIDNPTGFLFKTATNLAKNEIRRRVRHNLRYIGTGAYSEDELDQELASLLPNPERHASLREDVDIISAAIHDLPKRPRIAFVLNRFEGLSYKEISVVLSVSESSVEKYIMSALKKLRLILKNSDSFQRQDCHDDNNKTLRKRTLAKSLFAELSI